MSNSATVVPVTAMDQQQTAMLFAIVSAIVDQTIPAETVDEARDFLLGHVPSHSNHPLALSDYAAACKKMGLRARMIDARGRVVKLAYDKKVAAAEAAKAKKMRQAYAAEMSKQQVAKDPE